MANHQLLVAREGTVDGLAELTLTESEVKTRLMINDGFINTYDDLRKNDPDWTTIEKIKVNYGDRENLVRIFEIITTIRNRLEVREEHFKQIRKDDQIKKNNQLKIIEEQMKDRVIYKERKDFIAWCYDMKIFIQGIPDSVEDSMKIGYIKRTIENKDLKDALQICKTSSEVLTTIAERHIDDKNIIADLFKPIYAAKMPTT